jgi:cell division protein FtsL
VKIKTPDLKALKTFSVSHKLFLLTALWLVLIFISSMLFLNVKIHQKDIASLELENKLRLTAAKLSDLQNQDQYKINQKLAKNIKDIESSYKDSLGLYERILDVSAQKENTDDLEKEFAQSLEYLYQLKYSSASASLKVLTLNIEKKEKILAAPVLSTAPSTANLPVNNTPPSGGFSVQRVSTENGDFTVYIVAADLNSTKVIVDTASDGDCGNNCPALSLSDYVSRSGAFAGINGTYFCPPEYPSCAGKTGSFDLLVMNKNKVYFNSDNNVYSTNPAVIFSGNSARFVGQALQWGRDTGVDAVLSNYPLLVSGGNVSYSGGGDPKFAPKGARTFIAAKGNMVYIGVIFNASMGEGAIVLKTLGMDNALNLDQGGSTALWSGGYKAGPGRNIPNAILFVHK